MNAFNMQRLALSSGLLFSLSLPLQANPQAPFPQPVYPPQPAPVAQNQVPVFTAPEYIEEPVKAIEAVTGNTQPMPSAEDVAKSVADAAASAMPTAPVQPQEPTQAQPEMPPIGAYGYADQPAGYIPPVYLAEDQITEASPMDYGYPPDAYYAQPYPPAGYVYPQAMPNQNNNPFNNLESDFFSGENPFTNPMDHEGYWASPNFRPWSSGPLAPKRWNNHPMNNMPWGTFPGWGDGFFGGFGPDNWKGVTPWGNNVPFRWVDPADPRESIANMWDDAINTPNNMGRMPPGWTAPYISVPNPVDVADEFEKNARRFPDEINNMIDIGDDD